MSSVQLIFGDCLEKMKDIPDENVDMILCDLPYGTTQNKWDSVIPFEPLWEHYRRVIKPNAAIVLTASQPFTSSLVMSNISEFKYQWIWDKKIPSGMNYARYQPMRQHEDVLVFCSGKTPYNPQMVERDNPIKGGKLPKTHTLNDRTWKTYDKKNPTTILSFDKVRRNTLHPTQKPVVLMEYLIRTYTKEGDFVLDNTMGSGTTGVACVNTGRNFIGIELDEGYFKIAEKRIAEARAKADSGANS